MYCGNGEHWGWQRDERCLQKHFNGDISQCLWDEVTPNGEDLSYMLDETTPFKACGDLAYHVDHDANMNKEHEEWRGAHLQLKRRRLQFDTQLEDSPFCDEEITPVFLKSNETKESLEEVFPQASRWDSAYQDISASSYNGLDQSSERWIADCFNDSEIHFSPNDMNLPGASDIQIDISDFCNDPPEFEANVVQKCVTRTPRNVVFKGMKSFIQTPTKLAISVAYPFAFIKPCGVHGDVTLNEINRRIRTPPSKAKLRDEEPVVYPMSAFSGNPVVGKTKIRTEGGKGNITIMRTKG
ncbi:protein XRI1 isoform X2 [Populus alba]|uniref:protein XRI1 isoform X2 n=1 Tax=Populus alba TaxID=43335 RepID=UPI0015897712|nr:protein XRI1-like isoform X2 [Populus alba]